MKQGCLHIAFVGQRETDRGMRACDSRLRFIRQLLSENHKVSVVDFSCLEFFRLLSLHRKNPIDILHVYSNHFLLYCLYWCVGCITGAKVMTEYVEYRSACDWNRGVYNRVNAWLCDRFGAKLWDACIPISNFLHERTARVNPAIPQLKIAPVCDFSQFDEVSSIPPVKDYCLYCCNVSYVSVIDTVVRAYRESKISCTHSFILVLNGSSQGIEAIRKAYPDVMVLCSLPYSELIGYYRHASLLLAPLRETVADIARFPNKVCEYCAARGVILTTAVGEMNQYFQDGINAIVAERCTVDSLRAKMDIFLEGQYDSASLRENAYQLGKTWFSIESYRQSLDSFIRLLCSR